MLGLGKTTRRRGEDLRQFSTTASTNITAASIGLAHHVPLCLKPGWKNYLHRNMPAGPEPFLKAIASSRADLVVCVEWTLHLVWGWPTSVRAKGFLFVLGHALYMKAIHGGKAKHDRIDAQNIAVLLRGGMLPQAYVYPAAMRATRDLLRRRIHFMRKRAELLTHVQNTNSQYNLPALGQKIAYKANRDGVAERFPDPAVHKSIAVDLALKGLPHGVSARA